MIDLVIVKRTVLVLVEIIVVVVVVRTSFSGVTVMTVVPKQVESTVSYSIIVVVRLPSGQQPGHSPQPPLDSSVVMVGGRLSVGAVDDDRLSIVCALRRATHRIKIIASSLFTVILKD
jgi:hypothetical protein